MTPHDKPKDLEAIVEALLFTAAVQPMVTLVGATSLWIGAYGIVLGEWNDQAAFVVSVILGLLIGVASGVAANRDVVHELLRKCRLTKQTSFPSEWYRQLFCEERWVILTMRNGDRIRGWPQEYPNSPEKGHFSLRYAAWLPPGRDPESLEGTQSLLVPAADVLYLEVLQLPSELNSELQGSAAAADAN